MTTHSESLLATVHSLRNHLRTTFPNSEDGSTLHPLSSVPPSQLSALRDHLSTSITTLRSSLNSFQALLPTTTEDGTSTSRLEFDKYLSLLLQSSTTESTLLSLSSSTTTTATTTTSSNSVRRRGRDYPTLHPEELRSTSNDNDNHLILPILERIARDLGLVSFRDDDDGEGDASKKQKNGEQREEEEEEVVTISLGGKVMVVDFKIHRQTSKRRESVEREGIKVAYVWKGEQYFDEKSAKHLSKLFENYDNNNVPVGGGNELVENKEELWSNVGNILRELHELDERTEKEEQDYFARLNKLVDSVEKEFPFYETENPPPAPRSLPALLRNPSSLYPLVLLDISPSALLYPTAQTLVSSTSPTWSTLRDFLRLEGVYAAEFKLPRNLDPTKTTLQKEPERSKKQSNGSHEWYQVDIVSPEFGIPISREIGKRIWEQVDPRGGETEVEGQVGTTIERLEVTDQQRSFGKTRRGKTMSDLIRLAAWTGNSSRIGTGFRSAEAIGTVTSSLHTISFESSSMTSNSMPHAFKFKLAEDATRPAGGSTDTEQAFVCNNLWISENPRDQAGMEGGESMKRLRKVIEVLREQIRMNDLILSVINPSTEDQTSDNLEGRRASTKRKRRKLDGINEIDSMRLDDLFGDDATSITPLPVFIHANHSAQFNSATNPPSILLSFPSPHLPPQSATPMTILLRSTSTGYDVELSKMGNGVEIDRFEKEKAEKVLELTRDLGVFMRWVVKSLS